MGKRTGHVPVREQEITVDDQDPVHFEGFRGDQDKTIDYRRMGSPGFSLFKLETNGLQCGQTKQDLIKGCMFNERLQQRDLPVRVKKAVMQVALPHC